MVVPPNNIPSDDILVDDDEDDCTQEDVHSDVTPSNNRQWWFIFLEGTAGSFQATVALSKTGKEDFRRTDSDPLTARGHSMTSDSHTTAHARLIFWVVDVVVVVIIVVEPDAKLGMSPMMCVCTPTVVVQIWVH